jgi:RHS repeat-associated protein
VNGTTAHYQIDDTFGGTRLVITSNAASYSFSDYQPYGSDYGHSGVEEFTYTRKMLDTLTGLYYFAARLCDDSTGRFITEDSNASRGIR